MPEHQNKVNVLSPEALLDFLIENWWGRFVCLVHVVRVKTYYNT